VGLTTALRGGTFGQTEKVEKKNEPSEKELILKHQRERYPWGGEVSPYPLSKGVRNHTTIIIMGSLNQIRDRARSRQKKKVHDLGGVVQGKKFFPWGKGGKKIRYPSAFVRRYPHSLGGKRKQEKRSSFSQQ